MKDQNFKINNLQLGLDFKEWAARLKPDHYPAAELEGLILFQYWVRGMSTRQASQLAAEIADLCSLNGFDMTWFRSSLTQLQLDPQLTRLLTYFGVAAYLVPP